MEKSFSTILAKEKKTSYNIINSIAQLMQRATLEGEDAIALVLEKAFKDLTIHMTNELCEQDENLKVNKDSILEFMRHFFVASEETKQKFFRLTESSSGALH